MKKFLLVCFILFSYALPNYAQEISYDKSDFAPIYTVIDDAMIKAGFKGIESEWWHFTLKNEPHILILMSSK